MSNKYIDKDEWLVNDPVAIFITTIKNLAPLDAANPNAATKKGLIEHFRTLMSRGQAQFVIKMFLNEGLKQGNTANRHIMPNALAFNTRDVTNAGGVRATVAANETAMYEILDMIKDKGLDYAWLYHNTKSPEQAPVPKLFFKINFDGSVDIINENKEKVTSYIPDTVNARSVEQCNTMTGHGEDAMCRKSLEIVLGLGTNMDNVAPDNNAVEDFIKMEPKNKVSFAYSICKSLHWPVKDGKLAEIKDIPDEMMKSGPFFDAVSSLQTNASVANVRAAHAANIPNVAASNKVARAAHYAAYDSQYQTAVAARDAAVTAAQNARAKSDQADEKAEKAQEDLDKIRDSIPKNNMSVAQQQKIADAAEHAKTTGKISVDADLNATALEKEASDKETDVQNLRAVQKSTRPAAQVPIPPVLPHIPLTFNIKNKTIGSNHVTKFFNHCVKLINDYPELLNLKPRQVFSKPRESLSGRLRNLNKEQIQSLQTKNIMQTMFSMTGGAHILTGAKGQYGIVNGQYGGGGVRGFADAFAANLDQLVLMLKSQGKSLTQITANKIMGHINTIRDLETKLNEFSDKLNAYVRSNPNDGQREVSEDILKSFNTTTRHLTNKIVLVSDGLFKITGHLQPQTTPSSKTPGYRNL